MWKLIIILVLILYLLNKISVILFRVMGRQTPPSNIRPNADGNIHVNNPGKPVSRKGGIKGGEYVDYEEVK